MEDKVRDYYVHPSAIVETEDIGAGSRIWAFVHILNGVRIGKNANICDSCFIEQGATLGDNVTLKPGIHVCDGVVLEDDVFLAPNVGFTNDMRPRSKHYKTSAPTLLKKGASIGANSVIVPGITIGRYAMAGVGSVITNDVPDHALVYGNPARLKGWVDENGEKLESTGDGKWVSQEGIVYIKTAEGLAKK